MRICGAVGTSLLFTGLVACGAGGGNQTPQSISAAPVLVAPATTAAAIAAPAAAPTSLTSSSATVEFRQNAAAYASIGLPAAHDAGWSGRGVTIGVVDDGIDAAAGEFAGRVSPLSHDFGHDEQLVNGSYSAVTRVGLTGPYTDHGVKVAAILGAARDGRGIVGIAPEATLVVLRTDVSRPGNGTEYFPDDTVAAAISYAGDVGVRLLNISLSRSGRSEPILAATTRFAQTGGLIVFAAGNSGSPDPDIVANITDANRLGIILVGGLAATGNVLDPRSSRAGVLADRFIVAPMDVVTLAPDGTTVAASGTSFAAPMVTGAAALLLQKWPQLSGAQAGEILLTTARDLGAPGTDAIFGRGLLDIAAAIAPVDPVLAMSQKGASLAGATLALPKAFGPTALRTVLNSAVVTDRWGRDFGALLGMRVTRAASVVSLRSLTLPQQSAGFGLPGLRGQFAWSRHQGAFKFGSALIRGDLDHSNVALAFGGDPWGMVAGSSALIGPSGLAAYAPQANVHLRAATGDDRLSLQLSQGSTTGGSVAAIKLAWQPDALTVTGSVIDEHGTLFGQASGGALKLASAARTLAVEASRTWNLSAQWMVGVRAGAGITKIATPRDSLFRTVGPFVSSQFAAELRGAIDGGELRFSISQPLTVEHGAVMVLIPDRYDLATRTVLSDLRRVSIASERRAFQAGVAYQRSLGRGGTLRLSATHDLGSTATVAVGRLSFGF